MFSHCFIRPEQYQPDVSVRTSGTAEVTGHSGSDAFCKRKRKEGVVLFADLFGCPETGKEGLLSVAIFRYVVTFRLPSTP